MTNHYGQSIRSDALEPGPDDYAGGGPSRIAHKIVRWLPVYGLPVIMVLLIALFSILLPQTFPTFLNVRAILGDKAVIAVLALAAMVPMVTGKIDLSVGYGVALWHILAVALIVQSDLPWPVAVLIVLLLGAILGVINGLLVELAQIDAFIATLGTGTILYAISLWYTGGRQVVGHLPDGFLLINAGDIFGIPLPAFYVLAIALALWVALEYLPLGRYFYAIGANPRAAQLNGISVRSSVILAFVVSGVLGAFAGVLLASKLRIGQASVGLEFLLPALVGAFLGSTTIRPGRVNVWGTLIGVSILAVGISGIQQFGGEFYVEPLFNGATLIVAIGLASHSGRRRAKVKDGRNDKKRSA
ncbi:ABC transporter permease [Mesorhizobium ventifaucium]|uniref:Ribose ABC transport system, permease protein RbsC (TC 3.A.1.2.1) n=1 Tax=Mesorhizobium ventifaucium TaxID=666020 RepID=A0ABM9DIY6_9HYPH|nr:ABC transporter permease [Mesorhizobium ventifaucium]CAH2396546.1 Ribose ABC transport system, permease protein RbsC (TC 3.A.1.2.1) [Mesorhizobium ventifaucium]